jgi:hypothetical protein
MTFFSGAGWQVQFCESDLKTPLPRMFTFADPEKIRELARRGEASGDSESRQMLEYAIEKGRGGLLSAADPRAVPKAATELSSAPAKQWARQIPKGRRPTRCGIHRAQTKFSEMRERPRPAYQAYDRMRRSRSSADIDRISDKRSFTSNSKSLCRSDFSRSRDGTRGPLGLTNLAFSRACFLFFGLFGEAIKGLLSVLDAV